MQAADCNCVSEDEELIDFPDTEKAETWSCQWAVKEALPTKQEAKNLRPVKK